MGIVTLNNPISPDVPFGPRNPSGVLTKYGLSSIVLGSSPAGRLKLSELRNTTSLVVLVSVPENGSTLPAEPLRVDEFSTRMMVLARAAEAASRTVAKMERPMCFTTILLGQYHARRAADKVAPVAGVRNDWAVSAHVDVPHRPDGQQGDAAAGVPRPEPDRLRLRCPARRNPFVQGGPCGKDSIVNPRRRRTHFGADPKPRRRVTVPRAWRLAADVGECDRHHDAVRTVNRSAVVITPAQRTRQHKARYGKLVRHSSDIQQHRCVGGKVVDVVQGCKLDLQRNRSLLHYCPGRRVVDVCAGHSQAGETR